jgi:hypothetical protein
MWSRDVFLIALINCPQSVQLLTNKQKYTHNHTHTYTHKHTTQRLIFPQTHSHMRWSSLSCGAECGAANLESSCEELIPSSANAFRT